MRRILCVAIVALSLGLVSMTPVAARTVTTTTARENLSGSETGIPQPSASCPAEPNVVLSPFAGTATGSIAGNWTAGACHGPVPTTVGQSTDLLPGGYFTLSGTTSKHRTVSLYGAFGPGDGSITLVSTSGNPYGFNTQTYSVAGSVTSGDIQGGTVTITLTHYLFGTFVYSASVTGSASITY